MANFTSNTLQKQVENNKQIMEKMLEKCTEKQRNVFWRMYPDGPSEDQLDWAFSQIERTLIKNAKKGE